MWRSAGDLALAITGRVITASITTKSAFLRLILVYFLPIDLPDASCAPVRGYGLTNTMIVRRAVSSNGAPVPKGLDRTFTPLGVSRASQKSI